MNDRLPFNPLQAQEVAEAFNAAGVDYLFIGKSGAILLGYPGTTQDVDVFPAKSAGNGQRIVRALLALGFLIDDNAQAEIIRGKDFVQLTDGPFDLDLVFAPDGIESLDHLCPGDFAVPRADPQLVDAGCELGAKAVRHDQQRLGLLHGFRRYDFLLQLLLGGDDVPADADRG